MTERVGTIDLLDTATEHLFRAEQQEPTRGPWKRASGLGNCLRAQIFEMRGIPSPKTWDAKTMRVLAEGKRAHDTVKQAFQDLGLFLAEEGHLSDQELYVSGHYDLIIGGPVRQVFGNGDEKKIRYLNELRNDVVARYGTFLPVRLIEIKSQHSRSMKFTHDRGPSDHHMVQLATYKLLIERNPGQVPVTPEEHELLLVGRDAWGALTFGLTPRWVDEARRRIDALNEAWFNEQIPPCTCPSYWRKYCSWPDPDGQGCCSLLHLERAA